MLTKITRLLGKNKEILMFLVFGVLTTAVDFGISYMLYPTELNIHVIHVISWIGAVAFAYVTNRIFVFESKTRGFGAILREIAAFAAGRALTLVLQELVVFVLHDKLDISEYVVKLPAAVIVVVLNFIIGKLVVFRRAKK